MTQRCAYAVCSGISTANDDHVFVFGTDIFFVRSSESSRLLVFCSRNSIAKCTPSPSRLSICRSRGVVAPVASSNASLSFSSCSRLTPLSPDPPTSALTTKWMPSSRSRSPAGQRLIFPASCWVFRTSTVHRYGRPAHRQSLHGLPDSVGLRQPALQGQSPRQRPSCRCVLGGLALTHPSSKPLSAIAHSMFLIVTGGSWMPSTQAPSQGAGQTRPVNSGKLFVLCSRSSASFQRLL